MLTTVMRIRCLLAIAASAALVPILAACSQGDPRPAGVVTVSNGQCGARWQLTRPGWHTFQISNQGTGGAEVDLIEPATGAVYAEVENTGPGTTTPMRLNVGSGRYAFLCLFADTGPRQGPVVTVSGHVAGTRAVLPVTYNDLIPLAKEYQAQTESGLKVLAGQTAVLAAAVSRGNLAAARRGWLTAHLQYETLGDAYDAFGTFDTEIDGRADAVGVTSPTWTGFYRLEYGLWHGQSLTSLIPVARTLNEDTGKLVIWWQTQQVPLTDLGRRAHEVLENALEFQLTGHDDYGSGTTLATTLANIQATRALLTLLHPLLVPRYPGLTAVDNGLVRLQSLLVKERLPDGWWVPVAQLSQPARQAIDAACGQLLQELAPIASITEPRNTAHGF